MFINIVICDSTTIILHNNIILYLLQCFHWKHCFYGEYFHIPRFYWCVAALVAIKCNVANDQRYAVAEESRGGRCFYQLCEIRYSIPGVFVPHGISALSNAPYPLCTFKQQNIHATTIDALIITTAAAYNIGWLCFS